ncbi:hypothetical protein V6N13_083384 [Hibiscus sabdariffa]|uniref:RNase H type-1 domain-containing protein n=1 Tax=Hibiscus sabdariffa TaxID=183260 RepID=A0ABR2SXU9_9ROSI
MLGCHWRIEVELDSLDAIQLANGSEVKSGAINDEVPWERSWPFDQVVSSPSGSSGSLIVERFIAVRSRLHQDVSLALVQGQNSPP